MDNLFSRTNRRFWRNNYRNIFVKTRHQQNRHFQTDEII